MIDKNDPRLTAFVHGELDESERQEIQAAIDAQPELQTEVEQIQSASGQLELFFGAEPAVSLTSEQHDQLKSELGEEAKVKLADQDTIVRRQRARRFWAVAASILGLIATGWVCWEPMIEKVAEVYSASSPTEFSAPRKSDRDAPLIAAGGAPPAQANPELVEIDALVDSETWKDELKAAENAEQASKILEDRLFELRNKIVQMDPSGNLDESQIELREQTVSRLVDEKNRIQNLYRDATVQSNLAGPGQPVETDKFVHPEVFSEMGRATRAGQADGEQVAQPGEADFNKLKDKIRSTVDPEAWSDTNGDGQTPAYVPNLSLLVSQDQKVEENSLEAETAQPEFFGRIHISPPTQPQTDGFGVDLTGGINMVGSLDLDAIQGDDVAPPVMLPSEEDPAGVLGFDANKEYAVNRDGIVSDVPKDGSFNVASESNEKAVERLLGAAGKESRELRMDDQAIKARVKFELADAIETRLSEINDKVVEADASGILPSRGSELSDTQIKALKQERNTLQEALAAHKRGENISGRYRWETKTKNVPITRTRMETRTRVVPGGKTESYQVAVPYTEMADSYRVLVPISPNKNAKSVVDASDIQKEYIDELGATSVDKILPNLLRRVDPSGTREIAIQPLDNGEISVTVKGKSTDLMSLIDSERTARSETLRQLESQLADGNSDQGTENQIQNLRSEIAKFESAGKFFEKGNAGRGMLFDEWKKHIDAHNKKVEKQKPKSWRRVKATSNTSRLMVGDKDELDMQAMQVNVQVDGFRARVLVDCFYYNDRDRQLEGNFKIRLPDDSSLYYFAFGQSAYDFTPEQPVAAEEFLGKNYQFVSLKPANIRRDRQEAWNNVKESRMVPREKAAFAYSQTVRRRVDPALVEWSGAGVFNARVFPLVQQKLHRIVIGYDVNLTQTDDGWTYELNLPEQTGQCHVDLNVTDVADTDWQMSFADQEDTKPVDWKSGPAVDGGQSSRSSKRHRFSNPEWRSLRLSGERRDALVIRSDEDEKVPFFATRFKVELPEDARVSTDQQALFAVDTSLSSRPDKFNVWLDLLGATLNNNRDQLKKFAVVFFNVESHFWKTEYVDNTEENVKALIEYCYTLGLEGATDVHGVMRTVAETSWLTEDDAKPDLFLLSDGAANWGETNLHLIQNEIVSANVGSLFAYQTGMNGTAISNLRFLASRTGGAVFSVAGEDEVAKASTAFRNRPWRLDSIEVDGATDLLTAGRVEWVYPGQALTVVGRGAIGGGNFQLNFSQGSETKKVIVNPGAYVNSETASRLYGQVAVGQLERLGDKVFDVAAAYARYFRITGQTCSLLMLETEADYQRFNIKPEEDGFVVKSKNAGRVVATTLEKHAATIADPKSQLIGWIQRLEGMKQLGFKTPTALKIALDDMQVVAVDGRLNCTDHTLGDAEKKYITQLAETTGALNYDVIEAEALRRKTVSADDSLKAWSNLIERNAGDLVVAKDVAYTAMELERPGAAYHLLKRSLQSRPFDSSSYTAIGQCLAQLGQADMAMIYYEIALASKFPNMGADFHKIAGAEYQSLLRKVVAGKLESAAKPFAEARLETLTKSKSSESDLIVTMMWNTDSTDVDLHVTEPSGETCSYQNRRTKSGGQITADITNGFGPEMYTMKTAAAGKYKISAKYFGSNQNRTSVPSKVHLTIYRDFGSSDETVSRETIRLSEVGQVQGISSVEIAK